MIKNYITFDLETTGLKAEDNHIIEIGALKVINGKVCDRFMTFVKPPIAIPYQITQITGITNEMVSNAPEISQVIHAFVDFCKDYILLGHNVLFDYKFIKKYTTTYHIPFEKKGIDTLQIAKKVHRDLDSKSLSNLCAYYQIENKAAHRAYHDALATAKLYQILAHNFEQDNPSIFEPKELIVRQIKTQPCTRKQLQYLELLCDYHNVPMQSNAEKLTRSEMSKLIDRLISTYGNIERRY